MNRIDRVVSDTICNLRFPLILLVVMLHTFIIGESMQGHVYVPEGKYPHFEVAVYVLKACFGEIAIPLFFVISGFLFFVNVEEFDILTYFNKLKKRFFSLFIPYLCWNTLFILFVFVIQWIHPEWTGEKMVITNFTVTDWLNAYWELSNGLIPLWYVRDLMIISLFTPIIYFVIKKTGILLPVLLGILYLMNEFKYTPGLGTRCSFLFVLGSYFGIKNINFFALANKYSAILLVLYAVSIIFDIYLCSIEYGYNFLNQFTLFVGVFVVSSVFYHLTAKYDLHLPNFWAESSFFIFVFHMFIIYIPGKFWPLIIPVNIITIYIMQIFIPIIVSFSCMGVYWVCKKLMPQFISIIVGSR